MLTSFFLYSFFFFLSFQFCIDDFVAFEWCHRLGILRLFMCISFSFCYFLYVYILNEIRRALQLNKISCTTYWALFYSFQFKFMLREVYSKQMQNFVFFFLLLWFISLVNESIDYFVLHCSFSLIFLFLFDICTSLASCLSFYRFVSCFFVSIDVKLVQSSLVRFFFWWHTKKKCTSFHLWLYLNW